MKRGGNILNHINVLEMLRQHGLLYESHCLDVYVGFIEDAKKVVDFLTKRALDGKTMYYVPRKYRKKI